MLWIVIASQLIAPQPVDQVFGLRDDDYPMTYIEAGKSFEVKLRLTVRADGSLQGCAIEQSSGEPPMDKYTCALLLKRAQFKPAKDASGRPVLGVHRTAVRWTLDYPKRKNGHSGDLELRVARLPAGLKSPTYIDLAVATDPAGRLTDCASNRTEQNPALVKAACSEALRVFRATPARLPSGETVPSVQSVGVTFVSP